MQQNGSVNWIFLPTLAVAVSLVVAHGSVACPCADIQVPAEQPADVGLSEGLKFTHTAEYRKQFSSAISSAKRFASDYKRQHPDSRNLAIVSDIDETLLDNREEYKTRSNFVWDDFEAWILEARAPLLKQTAEFVKWARREGFAIFLVTGRPEKDRAATIQNLVKDGVAYDGLYMKPHHDHSPSATFKTETRKSIEDLGFVIVVNVGDNLSDLAGGHALDCEKLPNKMYFIQ